MSWERIVNTTIREYIQGEEVNILRGRKLLSMLKSKSRITFGHEGDQHDWKVRFKRAPMQGYAASDTLTFNQVNRWKLAVLPWRGYASTDGITKMEKLQNKGTAAIVKVFSAMTTNLMDDVEDQFGDELYIDGNASGNGKKIHGVESFFASTGTGAAAGYIVPPSDTYAGLSTVLGNYGGAWSTVSSNVNWPAGTGDAHYDFWSPLIVDYTDASWTAGTDTWPNTCLEAVRYGILHSKKNKSKRGQLDMVILNTELYRQFLDVYASKEQLNVARGDSKGGLYALGFSDVTNYDGVDVTSEYGVPSNVGYGFSCNNIELMSLQDQLFVPVGPDFDIASQSYRFSIDFFGNMKCNPRFQVKWINVT